MRIFNLKRFLLLTSATCLLAIPIMGEETKVFDKHINGYKYKVDGLWYSLDGNSSAVREGPYEGATYDGEQYSGDIVIPATVKIENKEYPVKAVGSSFNKAAKAVTSVTITGNTTIYGSAFNGCSELIYVILSNETKSISDNAFSYCPKLKKVSYAGGPTSDGLHLPPTVTSIEKSSFSGCTVLMQGSYSLPAQITSVGGYAFANCESLTKFSLPTNTKITKIPNGLFSGCKNLESITYSTPITVIGNSAFANCTKLYANSTFSLPSTLTSLGEKAFEKSGVKEVNAKSTKLTTIAKSAFANCPNLTDISLPPTLTTIDDNAFSYCTKLSGGTSKLINIPLSVTKIGASAYLGCSAFTALTIQKNVVTIGNTAFKNCTSLTKIDFTEGDNQTTSLHTIGIEAFNGCTALEQLILPNSLKELSQGAFSSCSSLSKISFLYPKKTTTLKSIGQSAFKDCISLTQILFQEGISIISPDAFSGCSALPQVDFPMSITNIEERSFQNCTGLKKASAYDVNVIYINNYAFANAGITKWEVTSRIETETDNHTSRSGTPSKGLVIANSAFYNCKNLEEMPENIISIGDYSFSGCTSLKHAYVPAGSSEIGNSTFKNMTALQSVEIPATVEKIGASSFYNCSSLTDICFPDALKSIGESAFYRCSSLKSISLGTKEWDGETADERVLEIMRNAFYSCDNINAVTSYFAIPPVMDSGFSSQTYRNATLSVPYGCLEPYKQDPIWGQFKNIVERGPLSSITLTEADGNDSDATSKIYSMDGRLVFSGNTADGVSKLPQGIYIIKSGSKTRKMMVR